MTDSGFVKAQSDNLPKVDSFMVAAFFANSPLYTSAEIRGIKADNAGRENYGDAAVGYVQLKRDGHLCIVKAKICPEHKVRSKDYLVTLVVNEQSETVEDVTCNDCPASSGGCKHAIAVLMWVHRRSEEPAVTEVECYWRKPTLSKIGTDLKYITLESFGKAPEQPLPNPSNGSFLQRFVETGKQRNINSEILRFLSDEESSLIKLGIHQLLSKYVCEGGSSAEDFFTYCKTVMTDSLCQEACQATVEQSENTLWHQLRYGRVTASTIYEVSRCKKSNGVLVEHIVSSMKIKETKAMQRGKFLEKKVLSIVGKRLHLKLQFVGLLLSPDFPFAGASPDAVSDDYVVEVKCPTSSKAVELYIKDGIVTNKCKAQLQLQMYFFKKQKGMLCVADPSFEVNNNVEVSFIDLDLEYVMTLLESAKIFWINNIFPVLKNSLTD